MVELTESTITTAAEPRIGPEELFRAESPRLWRSLAASFSSRDIADEAVAEAFAQLIRRGREVRHPERWIWRSAYRIAAGIAQRRTSERSIDGWDAPVVDREPDWELADAIRDLSQMQKSSLVLRYYGGYQASEIARMLSSTPAAVRVHLMRGRRRLRTALEEVPR